MLRDAFPWCAEWAGELKRLFAAYVAAKQAPGVLDYDDLLLVVGADAARAGSPRTWAAGSTTCWSTSTRTPTRSRPRSCALKPDGRGVTVVGDDAQAIYGFRAATVRNILDFPGRFAPPARVVALEQNYRSTQPILAAANAVIALARGGLHRKELFSTRRSGSGRRWCWSRDDLAQAEHVARQVLANREAGLLLRDQAVLFRAARHSAALELELARRSIPYVKYGGLRFFEAAHVKDVLAILRWAENPRDRVAAFRACSSCPGSARHRAAGARRLAAAAAAWRAGGLRPPPAAAQLWPRLARCCRRSRAWPAAARAGPRRFYDPLLEELYDFAAAAAPTSTSSSAWPPPRRSRERFLTELTLDPPAASGGPPARRCGTRTT